MNWFVTSLNSGTDMDRNKTAIIREETYPTFHSEEVQEIMGRKPVWILRWGVTVIVLISIAIILGSYYVKYPDTITASITLTSNDPPSDLAARASGILDSVFVKNGENVIRGQMIAIIASTARLEDILLAEDLLRSRECCLGNDLNEKERLNELSTLHLGDIQQNWIEYLAACSEYQDYMNIDQIGQKKKLLAEQVRSAEEYYRKLEIQRKTLVESLSYERKEVDRDSVLVTRKMISQSEYESTLKAFISKENSLAGFDASMVNAHLNRLKLEQQIIELDIQKTSEETEYNRAIIKCRDNLLGKIALWKEQFTIVAPCDGKVSFQNVWSKGQRVSTGEIITSIAPDSVMTIVGRLKVPSSGFGKVKVGQDVNIKLSGFPYLEFGIIKGLVKSISSVPEKTSSGLYYTVDIALSNGLISTYHQALPFVQDMDGTAEIITEDMRLIEQITRPALFLLKNR